MCGIAGFVGRRAPDHLAAGEAASAERTLKKMTDRLSHRGPDGSGAWFSPAPDGAWSASLGHRRLSIIDLEGGAQPLSNAPYGEGNLWITFNGEIFNFLDLKPALESRGHRFKTRGDTEVIVHHLEEHGGADGDYSLPLRDLNGMFAFALWDRKRERLTLARDRAGIKPLYYASLPDGGLVFASELTSLLQHPQSPRAIDPAGVAAYFFSDYVHSPGSILKGVRKLDPGCLVTWQKGHLSAPRRYWRLTPGETRASEPEAIATLDGLLNAAVRRQLIADVPVGVFLSGGIDSSVVAALAARQASRRVQTFSIAFEDADYDESAFARQVARHIGSDHVEETLTEQKLLDHLGAALDGLDEPLADPSIVPTYLLSRLARRHVTVALGGDAGDELFAGYPTYKAHGMARAYERVPAWVRAQVIERLVAGLPVRATYQSLEWKAKRFALRWDDEPARRHLRWMSNTDVPDLQAAFPGVPEPAILSERPPGQGLNAMLALDFATYMPGSVLTKVDRASMACSLEVRPPFLDNELIDWAFSLSPELKLKGKTSKYLLKQVALKYVPSEVVHRPKKGFAIPLARWLGERGPLADRLDRALDESSPIWRLAARRESFVDWAREHRAGRVDRSRTLWALIVLDHWMRKEQL